MITPRDFMTLAHRMANGTAEADWRTGVSRAYYASFHIARRLLEDLGFSVPPDERAHRYLSLRLSNCGFPTVAAAGRDLDGLRDHRNFADYDIHLTMRRPSAFSHLRTAEQIILALDSSRAEPTRTHITDAMKKYEQTVLGVVTWHP